MGCGQSSPGPGGVRPGLSVRRAAVVCTPLLAWEAPRKPGSGSVVAAAQQKLVGSARGAQGRGGQLGSLGAAGDAGDACDFFFKWFPGKYSEQI